MTINVSMNVALTAGGRSCGVHATVCLPQHGLPFAFTSSSVLNQQSPGPGGMPITAAAQPSSAMHAWQHSSLVLKVFGHPGGWSLRPTQPNNRTTA